MAGCGGSTNESVATEVSTTTSVSATTTLTATTTTPPIATSVPATTTPPTTPTISREARLAVQRCKTSLDVLNPYNLPESEQVGRIIDSCTEAESQILADDPEPNSGLFRLSESINSASSALADDDRCTASLREAPPTTLLFPNTCTSRGYDDILKKAIDDLAAAVERYL